eukprot:12908730-Prorocentrum_lima.AAC.1
MIALPSSPRHVHPRPTVEKVCSWTCNCHLATLCGENTCDRDSSALREHAKIPPHLQDMLLHEEVRVCP